MLNAFRTFGGTFFTLLFVTAFPLVAQAVTAKVAWDRPRGTGYVGYHLYWTKVGTTYPRQPSLVLRNANAVRATVRGLTPKSRYKIVIRSFARDGRQSNNSNEVRFTAAAAPPPSTPPGSTGGQKPPPPASTPAPTPAPRDTSGGTGSSTSSTGALRVFTGTVKISDSWKRVRIPRGFRQPIVLVSPASFHGWDPGTIRVRRVDTSGFDIRFQEWTYLNESHTREDVFYLVMEQGHYTLPRGMHIEAGSFQTRGNTISTTRTFLQRFPVQPVVFTTVVTTQDTRPVIMRVPRITSRNFQVRGQHEERRPQQHRAERIHYIAWRPGVGKVAGIDFEVIRSAPLYTKAWKTLITPTLRPGAIFLAAMQGLAGWDPATIRYRVNRRRIEAHVQEELSKDKETTHAPEVFGIVILGDL